MTRKKDKQNFQNADTELGTRGFLASQLLLYQTDNGRERIEVRLQEETVWLTQKLLSELFQSSKQNISLHLKNIFEDEELDEGRVVKEYLTTAGDGKSYRTKFYNLEAIISVGYRVRSRRGGPMRRPRGRRTDTIGKPNRGQEERLVSYQIPAFTDYRRLIELSGP